jgi:hypothetical protein
LAGSFSIAACKEVVRARGAMIADFMCQSPLSRVYYRTYLLRLLCRGTAGTIFNHLRPFEEWRGANRAGKGCRGRLRPLGCWQNSEVATANVSSMTEAAGFACGIPPDYASAAVPRYFRNKKTAGSLPSSLRIRRAVLSLQVDDPRPWKGPC